VARRQFFRERGESDEVDEQDRDVGKGVGDRFAGAQPGRDLAGQDVV
jgi:hypothetical protein